MPAFDALVAQAVAAPIVGWDFSWLDGRATEQRPTWRYARLVAARAAAARRMLDLQSGGGEMLDGLAVMPPLLVATEGYRPNVVVAATRLRPRRAHVVACGEGPTLPLRSGAFDLVTSRHPVATPWDEVARVLGVGGTFLSQQVGPHSVGELTEFMMGPQPTGSRRDPHLAVAAAEAAGLTITDLRQERLPTVFDDVGAVIYFLRLVVWIVPDFTIEKYRDRLRDLHDHITTRGPFVAHASRFLIEATK